MPTPTEDPVSSKRSVEHLTHFNCGHCHKWFSIADAPAGRAEFYCPWCGQKSAFELLEPSAPLIEPVQ